MANILNIEDDVLLLETMEDFLSMQGHHVTCARGGKEALDLCYNQLFDLYLWDINLPDINGLECLKLLRESGDKTPAIFITSRTDKQSLQEGFMIGGDDYIKKPFDVDELNLRIKAILSRYGHKDRFVKIDDEYSINTEKRILYKNGKEFPINQKDFALLCLLVDYRGEIITKEMIFSKLWSPNENSNEGSLRVYINNLKKLFGKESITNIRGVGYRFEIL